MKITIELEVGDGTGAIVGMLEWGISEAKEAIRLVPNAIHSQVNQSIQYATQIRDEINRKVNEATSQR